MTDRPITIVEPQLARLIASRGGRLRRPGAGMIGRCVIGDRLWVREPFHLQQRFAHLSPTAAARVGARPIFAADLAAMNPADRPEVGRRVFARNLLRQWHRQHLVVLNAVRQPLQAISQEEIEDDGFETREAWAAAWDRNLSLNSHGIEWARNPDVAVITFQRFPVALSLAPELGQQAGPS